MGFRFNPSRRALFPFTSDSSGGLTTVDDRGLIVGRTPGEETGTDVGGGNRDVGVR